MTTFAACVLYGKGRSSAGRSEHSAIDDQGERVYTTPACCTLSYLLVSVLMIKFASYPRSLIAAMLVRYSPNATANQTLGNPTLGYELYRDELQTLSQVLRTATRLRRTVLTSFSDSDDG